MHSFKKFWKQESNFKKWLSVIVGAMTILFVIAIFLPSTKPLSSIRVMMSPESRGPGLPYRLTIPKIGVDAGFEYVGVTSQGAMDAPKDPANVAWFDLGPRPGEKGNAVIDGHEGWKNGILVVFDKLHTLQKGDNVYVKDDKGVSTVFVVRELRELGKNDDASVVFSPNDGKAHLNLITCEGVWNAALKSYSNRLVVFTDKLN